jgi:type VI secretion system protein ImpH
MTKIEKFNELLHQMQSDIRLEVLLTDLVVDSLSLDDILIVSNSLFKRSYHHDIEKTVEVEYGSSKKKKLSIVVNREGMYDHLPEDLFHQPSDSNNYFDKERIIQEIKIQNELEKASRLFFLPFENEFYRQRVKLESEERKFLFETNSSLSGELFSDLWDLPDFLDDFQKSKLGVLMPVLNKIVGDLEMISFIMESITGDALEIKHSSPTRTLLLDEPRLGKMVMGVDGILAGKIGDLKSSLTIRIFLERPEDLPDFMPGGKKITIHEFLCNLFIPFETDFVFELDFTRTSVSFVADNETYYLGRLNYTTVI